MAVLPDAEKKMMENCPPAVSEDVSENGGDSSRGHLSMKIRTAAAAVLPSLMMCVGAAHFWRAALPGFSIYALFLAAVAWTRKEWARRLLLTALPLLAARWIWTAGLYVNMRLLQGLPWVRLVCILAAVALLTALAALLLTGKTARERYSRGAASAPVQWASAAAVSVVLLLMHAAKPGLFAVERFYYGLGGVQIVCAVVWSVWLAGMLWERGKTASVRMRAWMLFSLIFFAQLLLGLWADTRFLMSGTLHAPVPGLILAAPIYRGGGMFMLYLFVSAVLLTGTAWCSHLCYFGVWDNAAARMGKAGRALPSWVGKMRWGMLLLAVTVPLLLRFSGLPWEAAALLTVLLGGALIPCALLWSRKTGYPMYCSAVCPLGQLAALLGRLSPWRIRRTENCTFCGACVRACRHAAMSAAEDGPQPGGRCTLCRECLDVCHKQGVELVLYSRSFSFPWAEKVFVVLVVSLHTLFICMARI